MKLTTAVKAAIAFSGWSVALTVPRAVIRLLRGPTKGARAAFSAAISAARAAEVTPTAWPGSTDKLGPSFWRALSRSWAALVILSSSVWVRVPITLVRPVVRVLMLAASVAADVLAAVSITLRSAMT
jgi:hypothetical protein